jgi:hypothetical protein
MVTRPAPFSREHLEHSAVVEVEEVVVDDDSFVVVEDAAVVNVCPDGREVIGERGGTGGEDEPVASDEPFDATVDVVVAARRRVLLGDFGAGEFDSAAMMPRRISLGETDVVVEVVVVVVVVVVVEDDWSFGEVLITRRTSRGESEVGDDAVGGDAGATAAATGGAITLV